MKALTFRAVFAPALPNLLRQLACVSAAMKTYSLSVASAVALFAQEPAAQEAKDKRHAPTSWASQWEASYAT